MSLHPNAALLTLASPQFERLVQFYIQLLSLQPATYLPHSYAEFHLPGLRFGIFRPKHPTPQNSASAQPSGMALCLEVENLEGAIAHLTHLGYPPSGDIITAAHGREIYAFDPDGNWLILHQGYTDSQLHS